MRSPQATQAVITVHPAAKISDPAVDSPNGRAGIIVPEGVIFQSQAAYTQLRKVLVEDYLVAVVSLPAGVFNPYSGAI
jgi:type I restriction-modification system DNA methylase subunit